MAKLSYIFNRAADECLLGSDATVGSAWKHVYSCDAVREAVGWDIECAKEALDFLESAGVNISSVRVMDRVKDPQAVRYAWLKLCAQVAREEGL